jgi:threonyl-tRNA synthetase
MQQAPSPASARAGAPVFDLNEALEGQRRLLCAALAAAVREVSPGAVLGSCGTTGTGFYHDFLLPSPLGADRLPQLEAAMRRLLDAPPAEMARLSAEEALDFAADEPLLREELERGGFADETLVRFGGTSVLAHRRPAAALAPGAVFRLETVSGAYWMGDESRPMLTRVAGLAFASAQAMEEHRGRAAAADRRDHRRIGRELRLFVISEGVCRGLPMLLPRGAVIRRVLERFVVDEEIARGYEIVYTPDLGRRELYETSGHLAHYADAMFPPIRLEGEELFLRPMTCPHHFMLYRSSARSYRELPVRYAEIAAQYRRERSGELYGLSRSFAFHLADSHIMCRPDQVPEELDRVLDLVQHVMATLGFAADCRYRASLHSPGDDRYAGSEEVWDKAEGILLDVLRRRGVPYDTERGEAAFYGPKIDVQMRTVRGGEETLFTIQLDFVLPGRFGLEYAAADGSRARPVVIHRSSVGCLERTIALLLERYAGALPPWLAPVQARIIPVASAHEAYAREVEGALRARGLRAEVDARDETLGRRVRDARALRVPYLAVVGAREAGARRLSVRNRDTGGEVSLDAGAFADRLAREVGERAQRAAIGEEA